MNPMPNRAMDHDSKFDGFDQDGTNLTFRFSAAYIHESDSERGLDVGIDWVQDVRLHFANASIIGSMSQLPCYLWDGQLSLADESKQMVPVPLEFSGKVKLKLVENGEMDGAIEVTATHVETEVWGEPKYRENFPGLR
jgi:hypothetical protein